MDEQTTSKKPRGRREEGRARWGPLHHPGDPGLDDRVGARSQLEKFAIGEGGYKGYVARARISAEGELTWDDELIAATPEEKEKIEAEVKAASRTDVPQVDPGSAGRGKHHIASLEGDCIHVPCPERHGRAVRRAEDQA